MAVEAMPAPPPPHRVKTVIRIQKGDVSEVHLATPVLRTEESLSSPA
jgi:hypothetical protein